MPDEDLVARTEAVVKLTALFRTERLVYLAATGLAVAILLITAIVMLVNKQAGTPELTLLFGSSGIIAFTVNRLLLMWTTAMQSVLKSSHKTGEGDD